MAMKEETLEPGVGASGDVGDTGRDRVTADMSHVYFYSVSLRPRWRNHSQAVWYTSALSYRRIRNPTFCKKLLSVEEDALLNLWGRKIKQTCRKQGTRCCRVRLKKTHTTLQNKFSGYILHDHMAEEDLEQRVYWRQLFSWYCSVATGTSGCKHSALHSELNIRSALSTHHQTSVPLNHLLVSLSKHISLNHLVVPHPLCRIFLKGPVCKI